jgi:MarR family transcriptional regulator, 2-MHQ and catechol-resistance regulon repressor
VSSRGASAKAPVQAVAERGHSSSGVHLWLVLMKAHRSLARHALRSVERFGLGVSDFAILELLLHKGPQKVNTIGRRVGLTSGSITSAIDRLEAQGKVVRAAHPTDRRSRVVRLTSLGTAEARQVFTRHTHAMEGAAQGLSRPERDTLTQLLKKLGTAADELPHGRDKLIR